LSSTHPAWLPLVGCHQLVVVEYPDFFTGGSHQEVLAD